MVYKDGIFNVMDKAFTIVLEGPPRWPFALQAMQRVAIETPTQLDSHSRILKQCVGGYPDPKDPRGRLPFLLKV